MKHLVLKWIQPSSSGLIFLPSAEGFGYILTYLRDSKIPFEETTVTFASTKVRALSVNLGSSVRFYQHEVRPDKNNQTFYVSTLDDKRYTFTIPFMV